MTIEQTVILIASVYVGLGILVVSFVEMATEPERFKSQVAAALVWPFVVLYLVGGALGEWYRNWKQRF
jgi:hypothetical protein